MVDEHDDVDARDTGELRKLLGQVLVELRKISHPAFEAKLLEQIRGQLLKQIDSSASLRELVRDLGHDIQWLRKHIPALTAQLERLGVIVALDPDSRKAGKGDADG